jgi:ubiquinone/menaquinone biosynthesis C-methylase UbiE
VRRLVIPIALAIGCSSSGSSSTPARASNEDTATYEGRQIAATCSYLGADWLDRDDRDAREQPERVLDVLKIGPGMSVADVGAGTGYFTVRLARRVGPSGSVLATELQPEMLRLLDARVSKEKLSNVRLIKATEHHAALPERCCDLVLLVDVYHELSDPPGVIAGIRRSLRERGRLVLVEYRGEDPKVAIKPEHKMTLAQIKKELVPLGFRFVESFEPLPDQHIVVFVRDDAP